MTDLIQPPIKRRVPVWLIVVITIVLTVIVTVGVIRYYFWAAPFSAVELSQREQRQLDQKLATLIPGYEPGSSLSTTASNSNAAEADNKATLEPQPYTEEGASREVVFSEREINALIANNTDLASKLAIDLADNLVSARVLFDADPDMPIVGGKTVRITAGMTLSYEEGQPVAIIRGVKIMGVPVPEAWLGGLKNVDLIEQFGEAGGFWQAFAEGIDQLEVRDGRLAVTLAP